MNTPLESFASTAPAGVNGVPGAVKPTKSKVVAGLLGIFLGAWGVHKLYLGRTKAGLLMAAGWWVGLLLGFVLILPLFLAWGIAIVGFIEGIIYLTKSDQEFEQVYVREGKDWF